MTAVLERPDLAALTDSQLAEVASVTGDPDAGAATGELARRRQAKAAKIRAASRARREDPDAAAYANYQAASAYCNGDHNMLSEAGRRTGREAWPMLWEQSREHIEHLASHDLIVFWDYHARRPPSPNEYRDAEREALAEARERANAPAPGMLAAIAAARGEPKRDDSPPAAARTEPGSIARGITALRLLRREANALEQQYNATGRALARVNGEERG